MMKRYAGDLLCLLVCFLCAGVWVYRGDLLMALIFLGGAAAWIGRLVNMAKHGGQTAEKGKKTKGTKR
ncbi:hypothetical protein [Dysosmobacter sp.]